VRLPRGLLRRIAKPRNEETRLGSDQCPGGIPEAGVVAVVKDGLNLNLPVVIRRGRGSTLRPGIRHGESQVGRVEDGVSALQ